MVRVFTARIGTPGLTDALDVTRKSAKGDGLAFAPSWAILRPALDLRAVAKSLAQGTAVALKGGADDRVLVGAELARKIDDAAWALYAPAFVAEMRQSYCRNTGAWDRLLARETVTLLCYCTDPERCHRTLLAKRVLPKLEAVYAGEVPANDDRGEGATP